MLSRAEFERVAVQEQQRVDIKKADTERRRRLRIAKKKIEETEIPNTYGELLELLVDVTAESFRLKHAGMNTKILDPLFRKICRAIRKIERQAGLPNEDTQRQICREWMQTPEHKAEYLRGRPLNQA